MSGRPWLRVRSTHLSAVSSHSSVCLRHGGRFRLARIIRRHARERFVGSRVAQSSEIRSLNVKQPTSTPPQSSSNGGDQARSSSRSKLGQAQTGTKLNHNHRQITCTRCVVSCGSSQRELVSVTYRSDPRVSCWFGSASWLSDQNRENFRLKHSTRGLRAQSSSVRRIRLHTLNHDV